MLAAGARIGSFEILAPLGAGGMGEVYRARDTRLGREVAIKVLACGATGRREPAPTIRPRSQAAAAINHPHIVTIHEIESSDGIDFIVMECVPGQTLDELIPKSGMPAARGPAPRHSDRRRARSCPSPRHRPPRHQARERRRHPRRASSKVLDFGLAKLVADDSYDPGKTVDGSNRSEPAQPFQGRSRARQRTCPRSRRRAAG